MKNLRIGRSPGFPCAAPSRSYWSVAKVRLRFRLLPKRITVAGTASDLAEDSDSRNSLLIQKRTCFQNQHRWFLNYKQIKSQTTPL